MVREQQLMEQQRQQLELERKKRDELLFKLNLRDHEKMKITESDKNSEADIVFIRDFVVRYLSEVYNSLDKIEALGYVR